MQNSKKHLKLGYQMTGYAHILLLFQAKWNKENWDSKIFTCWSQFELGWIVVYLCVFKCECLVFHYLGEKYWKKKTETNWTSFHDSSGRFTSHPRHFFSSRWLPNVPATVYNFGLKKHVVWETKCLQEPQNVAQLPLTQAFWDYDHLDD